MQLPQYNVLIATTAICLICWLTPGQAQFWKMNAPSERDLFIMETKANMKSGICYKLVPRLNTDIPNDMQTLSYCCPGYQQSPNIMAMQCDPVCTEDCANGICIEPDVCECYPGYERRGGRCEEL